jgi:hypothetical protein
MGRSRYAWVRNVASDRDALRKGFLGQRVDAFPFGLRGDGELFMKLWRNPKIELPGVAAPWIDAFLFANRKKDIQ